MLIQMTIVYPGTRFMVNPTPGIWGPEKVAAPLKRLVVAAHLFLLILLVLFCVVLSMS